MLVVMGALMVGLIFAAVRGGSRRTRGHSRGSLETLDQRYARGEISTEEFEERCNRLDGAAD